MATTLVHWKLAQATYSDLRVPAHPPSPQLSLQLITPLHTRVQSSFSVLSGSLPRVSSHENGNSETLVSVTARDLVITWCCTPRWIPEVMTCISVGLTEQLTGIE